MSGSLVTLPDLRTVTRHNLDTRARIDRSSIPGGGDTRAFGLSDLGNVASRVIGRAKLVTDDTARMVSVRGADSLSMPLGRTPTKFLDDLRRIESILGQPVPDPELELLTRFTALRPTDPRRPMLDERLSMALQGTSEADRLGTGWPWEQADEFGLVAAIQVRGPGLPVRQVDTLTIDLGHVAPR